MHDLETKNRFIELRAQGWSLNRIAGELHVAKRTLVDWSREAQAEISALQQVEREALHERLLASHEEEISRLAAHLNRIEAVLAKRNVECLSTESLFVMAATVRAQLRRVTQSAHGFQPGSPHSPTSSSANPSPPQPSAPEPITTRGAA